MFDRARGVLTANAALKAYRRGDYDTALRKIKAAEPLFAIEPDARQRDCDLGRLHQLAGQVYMRLGDVEKGLCSFARAEEHLEKDPRNFRRYGEAMHDIAIYFAELGIRSVAEMYIEKAEKAVGHLPSYADQIQQVRRDLAGQGHRRMTAAVIESLRHDLESTRTDADRAMHSYNLGAALLEMDGADQHEAFAHVRSAVVYYAKRDREKFLQALSILTDSRHRGRSFPAWLDSASEHALRVARENASPRNIADAELGRAAFLLSRGDLQNALTHALTAVARNNEISARTDGSALRLFNNIGGEAAREVALQIACARNDTALAAELMESARLQVLPTGGATAERYRGMSPAGLLTTLGATRVSRMRPIAVDGFSHLASLYTEDVAGTPLSFEDCVRQVGGEDAWWWGAWGFNERIYWCVRGGGEAACGFLDAADGTELGDALETLLNASLVNEDATASDVLNGPLSSSYREEEALSTLLGHHLIPPVLRAELLRRIDTGNPLQLVLCGTLFAVLPTALLGIETQSSDRYPARLIDAAVPRVAPPAALMDYVDRHPTFPLDELPLSVACVDPCGDLQFARRVPPGTEIVLTHPGATPQALAIALRRLGPSHPSLFYYSGHVSGRGDVESGLALEGNLVTADLIFTSSGDAPALPFPSRVMLAACASSGAGGDGAGEWFGLASAILWAGARQVVATNWRVWDTPFTSRFDLDLAEALRRPEDAATALRAVQLKWLHRWRSTPQGANPVEAPLPVIWASYICIGARG
ncbi:CHAT domain-containing protein [Micromonospora sp. D75]|uniref:CHAT domain-containing protein n=1 Tax=Micromonospora sp. D75 TaxID=2824885 RepID=UPI001B368139|nr:CHAT domain-containing protein [Micromonospora sp. D75]MBQ1065233.1 CHAT domain-containing protein [Micromonospora sp. D75]